MNTALLPNESTYNPQACAVDAAHDSHAQLQPLLRRFIFDALLWCILAGLLFIGASNISALKSYSAVSLRYETPVSGQAAWQARQYAARQSDGGVFWATFWHETQKTVSGELRKADAVCIYFSGDANLVWPSRFLSGSAPGVTDGSGCAVSSALAWTLWGSHDIVGKTLGVDGEVRTIRGVFEENDPLALLCVRDEDKSHSFTAVELSGGPQSPARSDAQSFAAAAGLGPPDSILIGTPAFLSEIIAVLPLLTLTVFAVAQLAGYMKKRPLVLKGTLFIALLALAVLLPTLLEALPDWMIPTRWSDFSFWGTLGRQIGADLREYLALAPRLRDVAYKTLLLKQTGIAFLSMILALTICFRWRSHALQPRQPGQSALSHRL